MLKLLANPAGLALTLLLHIDKLNNKRKEKCMNYNDDYWTERFNNNTPEKIKNAIKRVYSAYPKDCMPQGVSDPLYIMNCIALELGIGDGKGNFKI